MILGVISTNWRQIGKEKFVQIRDEFLGPIRRALNGRKDQKGKTQLPNQFKNMQMLYDLMVAVCSNGVAYNEYMDSK